MSRIITLTTDFGLSDEYVGAMKGVILSRAPDAVIVDLSHNIGSQNIRQAAMLISSAYRYFPAQTIHVVVVDPGVGSSRRLILLQADNHYFLAPDNGVLGLLLKPQYFQAAFELDCAQYYLSPISATFHGRDILAPVAGQLAAGLQPAAIGPSCSPDTLRKLMIPAVRTDIRRKIVVGKVIDMDHFGNLQTNITAGIMEKLYGPDKKRVRVMVKGQVIVSLHTAYSEAHPGELLVLINSRNYLEIAVNQGNAAQYLAAAAGDEVTVSLQGK